MAKSKTTTLPRSLRDNIGIVDVAVSDVRKYGEKQPHTELLDVGLAATISVTWQYDAEYGNEFFDATFTSEQLFKLAVSAGLLGTTASGYQKLPRGVKSLMRCIAA